MSVELHCAFVWDCDECGKENFERAIEGNIDEAALEADENQVVGFLVAPEGESTEHEDGQMMESDVLVQQIAIAPKRVTCLHCGTSHETDLHMLDEDNEEFEDL